MRSHYFVIYICNKENTYMSQVPGPIPPPPGRMVWSKFWPPGGAKAAPTGGQETDAADEPQDAPQDAASTACELILLVFIDKMGCIQTP